MEIKEQAEKEVKRKEMNIKFFYYPLASSALFCLIAFLYFGKDFIPLLSSLLIGYGGYGIAAGKLKLNSWFLSNTPARIAGSLLVFAGFLIFVIIKF
jgi:hypothetical protein